MPAQPCMQLSFPSPASPAQSPSSHQSNIRSSSLLPEIASPSTSSPAVRCPHTPASLLLRALVEEEPMPTVSREANCSKKEDCWNLTLALALVVDLESELSTSMLVAVWEELEEAVVLLWLLVVGVLGSGWGYWAERVLPLPPHDCTSL